MAEHPQGEPASVEDALERALSASRGFVIVPVVLLVLAALGAFAYASYVAADAARRIVDHPTPVGDKIGLFLLVVDLVLIGATLLITAVGLYELFISRRHEENPAHIPVWLVIRDLNDLKARVIGMVVLVAAVGYVESIVDVHSGSQALDTGVGIAVVVLALSLYLKVSDGRA